MQFTLTIVTLATLNRSLIVMCLYWKKKYLCGCESHIFKDRCIIILRSPNGKCDQEEIQEEPRKSYFKCYDCIRLEVEVEKSQAKVKAEKEEEQRKKDEEKARKLQIRKNAEMRAQREREEDARRDRELKAAIEREKREGGVWVDASNKKTKGRKGGAANLPSPPMSAPATIGTFRAAGVTGAVGGVFAPLSTKGTSTVNNKLTAMKIEEAVKPAADIKDQGKETKGSGIDPGGRAGHWGPKNAPKSPPKKILKHENLIAKKA